MASQKERILALLERPPLLPCDNFRDFGIDDPRWEEVCGSVYLEAHMPRYAARINDLRNDGHTIETGRCKVHKTATYRLVTDV